MASSTMLIMLGMEMCFSRRPWKRKAGTSVQQEICERHNKTYLSWFHKRDERSAYEMTIRLLHLTHQ